jgi:hypothetical protein
MVAFLALSSNHSHSLVFSQNNSLLFIVEMVEAEVITRRIPIMVKIVMVKMIMVKTVMVKMIMVKVITVLQTTTSS